MFLISSTSFPSSVTMHSHLIPLSSSTYILPLSRYRSIIFSCSSANRSKSRYCFLFSLTSIIFINRTYKFRVVELSRVYHTRGRMTTHIYENLPEMHPSGTKSSARHLASGVCASDMKKSHADTVTVQTWDLMLFRPGRTAGTDPDRRLQSLTRPNRRRSRRLREGRCR